MAVLISVLIWALSVCAIIAPLSPSCLGCGAGYRQPKFLAREDIERQTLSQAAQIQKLTDSTPQGNFAALRVLATALGFSHHDLADAQSGNCN